MHPYLLVSTIKQSSSRGKTSVVDDLQTSRTAELYMMPDIIHTSEIGCPALEDL